MIKCGNRTKQTLLNQEIFINHMRYAIAEQAAWQHGNVCIAIALVNNLIHSQSFAGALGL